jgi:hypothetical protein
MLPPVFSQPRGAAEFRCGPAEIGSSAGMHGKRWDAPEKFEHLLLFEYAGVSILGWRAQLC